MKKLVATAALAAQFMSGPAVAASLQPVEFGAARSGAFAGARLKLPIGGREPGQMRAGLGIGPMLSAQGTDGRIRTSFGDGLEFGMRESSPARLSIAGRSLDEIRLQADGKKGGVPTWALIAGGVVIAVGIGAAVSIDRINDASD
jgi:opacity protein-like surface antigen